MAGNASGPGSSVVERFLGKEEVGSSILLPGFNDDNFKHARAVMADTIHLECTECSRINYTTFRNKKTQPEKVVKKKYCRWDRKHTEHKETK